MKSAAGRLSTENAPRFPSPRYSVRGTSSPSSGHDLQINRRRSNPDHRSARIRKGTTTRVRISERAAPCTSNLAVPRPSPIQIVRHGRVYRRNRAAKFHNSRNRRDVAQSPMHDKLSTNSVTYFERIYDPNA